jgi:hypothetical protein
MLMGVPGELWVYGVVPWSVPKSSRDWTTRKSSPPVLERDKKDNGREFVLSFFCL